MEKVFIDPGHGGNDPGAVANGIIEKNINLTVALKLKELLICKGFDVKLSRDTDTYVSLTERCNMANDWNADIFVSIHHNAGGGDGYEVIHTIHTDMSLGDELAQIIGQAFGELGQNCRMIYSRESTNYPNQDYYTVIQNTNMAAIITEYAFIDTMDVQVVDTIEELYDEAGAIYKGICKFFNVEIDLPENEKEEEEMIIYKTINDIPDYGKETIQNLIDKGWLKGKGEGIIDVSEDMLRIFVILERAGVLK
jgi:N-acetylmuramoyl-L-alanine amidase